MRSPRKWWVVGVGGLLAAGGAWLGFGAASGRDDVSRQPLPQLEAAARRGNADPRVYRELADRYLQRRNHQDALAVLDRAAQLDPYNAENPNLRGMVLAELGRSDEATKAFREAASLDPKSAAPHLNLGRLALRDGSLYLASQEFATAKALAPSDPEPAIMLAQALKERGYSISAKAAAREAIALAPDHPEAHAVLGMIYADFGQPKEAREALQKAIDLGDDRPQTRAYLGLAYALLPLGPGDLDRAIELLRHAEGVGEAGPQLHYGLGLAHFEKGDYAAAEAAFHEGLRRTPGSEGMNYGLARVMLKTGREAEGRRMMARYGEIVRRRQLRDSYSTRADAQKDRPDLRVAYADLLFEHGNYAEAAAEYVKAVDLLPDSPDLYRKLARASEKAGRPQAAEEAGARARALEAARGRLAP